MTLEMVLLWLPSLLISVVSLAVFVYLSYRNRQKIDGLEQRLHEAQLQRVEHFLTREAQSTRQRIKQQPAPAEAGQQSIEKLRLIWLEAELTALVDGGRHRSNYELVVHGVQPLARLVNRPATKTDTKPAAAPISTPAQDQLQKARTTLNAQNELIAQYRQRNPAQPGAADAVPSGFANALGGVGENTNNLLTTIARLESELSALQQKLDATEHQTRLRDAVHGSDVVVVSTAADRSAAARTLLEETEQAYRQSVAEMTRMRDINSQQRALILQLDNELSSMRKDSTQHQQSSEILEKLKLQLRDYETCTVILEEEADTLRSKIDSLKKMVPQETATTAAPLAPPLLVKSEPVYKSGVDTLAVIESLTNLDSAEAIVATLIEWLRLENLSAVILVRRESNQIWGSSEGGVDSHSKQLMQSLVPQPGKPRVNIDEGTMLAYPVCRVLIYANSRLDNEPDLLPHLQQIINIADRWLLLLSTSPAPGNSADTAAANREMLREQLAGVLAQYNYVTREHGRVGEKFRTELHDFLKATDISQVQQQVAMTMLDDFDAQLDIIGKASKLIYTRLKAVTEDLQPPSK